MPPSTTDAADPDGKPGSLAYAERMLDREGTTGNEASAALAKAFEYVPAHMLEHLARNNVKFRMLPEGESVPDYIPGHHVERTRAAYYPKEKTCYIEYEHREPGVIIHELAHAVDHTLGGGPYLSSTNAFTISRRDFNKEATAINDYAKSNAQEYFAEALRLWLNVPEPKNGRWNGDDDAIKNPRKFGEQVAPEAMKFIKEISDHIRKGVPGLSSDTPLDQEEAERRRKLHSEELQHFKKEVSGEETIYRWRDTAAVALHDDGENIVMPNWGADSKRDVETIRAGLALMSTRHATVQLNGSRQFKLQALKIAIDMGITISNPELHTIQEHALQQKQKKPKPHDNAPIKARL